jgi:hypothetical protein
MPGRCAICDRLTHPALKRLTSSAFSNAVRERPWSWPFRRAREGPARTQSRGTPCED